MPRSTEDFAIGPHCRTHKVYTDESFVAGKASRTPRKLRYRLGANDYGRVGLNCSRPTWSSCDTGQVEAEHRNIRGVDRRSPVDDIKHLGVSRVSDGNREFCSEGGFDKSRKRSHVCMVIAHKAQFQGLPPTFKLLINAATQPKSAFAACGQQFRGSSSSGAMLAMSSSIAQKLAKAEG